MEYKIHNIDGLDVILVDMDSKVTSIQFFVRAGSIFEENNFSNGTAHFLEHMFFKGGKKYNNEKKLSQGVEKFGGHQNAYTSKKVACYHIECSNDNTKKSLEILSDMLIYPNLNQKKFESEKGVIMQELSQKFDNTNSLFPYESQKFIYGENNYGNPVIGSKNSLENLKYHELRKFYEKYYVKKNSCLVIAGKLDKKILDWIKIYFKDLPEGNFFQQPQYDKKNLIFEKKNKIGFYEKGTNQIPFSLIFQGVEYLDKDKNLNQEFFDLKIGAIAFGGLSSSRLFSQIREKMGLCYYIGANNYESLTGSGMFEIYAGVNKEKFDKVINKIENMLKDFEKKPFTKKEFENAKGYEIGSLKMGMEGAYNWADYYGNWYIDEKKIISFDEFEKLYKNTSLERTNEIFKKISNQKEKILYYIK